ncbi:MAG: TetR/AcrR family transcriptional regulator [Myxococcales bacterium]|nr:TetR/AcrR family transcriptional regulator [Myxococcales bacterium]
MGRPPNPKLRDDILRSGRQVFAEVGLESARVEEITRRAGVSKGSFYLHFEGKEQLFEQLVRQLLEDVLAELKCHDEMHCTAVSVENIAAHAGAELHATMSLLELFWHSRDVFRMLMELGGSPLHLRLRREFVTALVQSFRATFDANRHPPELQISVDPDVFSLVTTGAIMMLNWRMLDSAEKPDLWHYAVNLHRLLIGGVAVPETASILLRGLDEAVAAERTRRTPPSLATEP